MKITNNSDSVAKPSTGVITPETIHLSDVLPSDKAQQYIDGIRSLEIKAGAYLIVPNLYACNSVALKAFYDATDWASTRLVLDDTTEPTGADPTHEVNGPILGLAAL